MNKATMNLLEKAEAMLGAYSSFVERSAAIDKDTTRERSAIDRVSDHLFVLRRNGPATDLKAAVSRTRLANAADCLADYSWRLGQMSMWAAAEDAPGCAKMSGTFERMANAADAVRAQLADLAEAE